MADKAEKKDRHRMFRALFSIDASLWKRFGDEVGDTNRAGILRSFVAWYVGEPGAKLPRRPRQD